MQIASGAIAQTRLVRQEKRHPFPLLLPPRQQSAVKYQRPEVKTTVNNLWELFMLCKTFAPISPTQGFSVGFRARTIPPMSRREFYSTIGEGVMVCLHHRYIQTTEVMLTPVSSCPVALTHTVQWIQFFFVGFWTRFIA